MPNAKPFPLYTDGTNIYTSFDGGATFITISSGGGGTIHTSAPLSGDGSVGTPATIAAHAIPLTALATQPDQTLAGNVSGGAASPVPLTKTQALALLGIATPAAGFGLMAARAAAWGAALATPYVFNNAYQEDFVLGSLTVAQAVGGSGAVAYSTTANNLGGAGVVKVTAGATGGANYADVTSLNLNAWIADLKNTTFYASSYAQLTGVDGTSSVMGVGVLGAGPAVATAPFVLVGAFHAGSATNWGMTMYDGTTQTYHAGSTAFDATAFHYLDLAHDAVAHMYYFFVDGTQVDSWSDSGMAASKAGTPFGALAQAMVNGVLIDKAFCAV